MAPGQLEEVVEVLKRPKIARRYPIAPADTAALVDLLRTETVLLPAAPASRVCRDPDDDALLGRAVAGGVDYLVTGDADLLSVIHYRGAAIVGAREFLALLTP